MSELFLSPIEETAAIFASEEETFEETSSLFEQEFTEEDVLPFLLQAQDIISKLESRVVELESDLSTIHRKYDRDRNEWLVGLSQKDQYISHLSSKLSKSEFNSKETIVLLDGLNMSEIESVKSTISLCLRYLRQTENPTYQQQQQQQQQEEEDNEGFEEGELERRQAAVNEWRRDHVIPDHSSTNNKSCDDDEPVNLMDGLSSISSSCCSSTTTPPRQQAQVSLSSTDISLVGNNSLSTYVMQNHDNEEDSNNCTNCKQLLSQLDQQIEQKAYLKRDIGSLASALAEEEDTRSTVEQDKEALEQDVSYLTSSLFLALNQMLMEEVTERDGIVQLNRETNGKLSLILDAWDTRELRLKQVKELLVQLDSIVHQSANASSTLSRRFSLQQQQSPVPNTATTYHSRISRSSIATNSCIGNPLRLSSIAGGGGGGHQKQHQQHMIRIDGFILSEFQHHLKSTTDNNTIPNTPFMKRVFAEDIEPCLFSQQTQGWWKSPWFKKKLLNAISKNKCEIQNWHNNSINNSNSSNSSNAAYSNYTDITTTSSCSISSANTTTTCSSHLSTISSQTSINTTNNQNVPMPPKTKCACCNILRVCEFKIRLPPPPSSTTQPNDTVAAVAAKQQPWLPIDRFCRDKLVAVCGFYNFMTHLKLLSNNNVLLSLFKQVMMHRRRMTLAQVGSIGLFEDNNNNLSEDEYSTSNNSNNNGSISRKMSSSSIRQTYQQQRRSRKNRESVVLDHSGSGSDTASVVSVSEIQAIEGTQAQIVIVH